MSGWCSENQNRDGCGFFVIKKKKTIFCCLVVWLILFDSIGKAINKITKQPNNK